MAMVKDVKKKRRTTQEVYDQRPDRCNPQKYRVDADGNPAKDKELEQIDDLHSKRCKSCMKEMSEEDRKTQMHSHEHGWSYHRFCWMAEHSMTEELLAQVEIPEPERSIWRQKRVDDATEKRKANDARTLEKAEKKAARKAARELKKTEAAEKSAKRKPAKKAIKKVATKAKEAIDLPADTE